ncbi:MAG: formylglycine-generating enzyme family protein [Candidatus Poribacteria bacterium]|nr:formylglycine-generating enzyme family protein [Candidatus Poribacteria bacterium]
MTLPRPQLLALLLAIAYLFPTFPNPLWRHKSPAFAQTPQVPEGMVRVPAGEFTMGSDDGAQHEKPKHTVFLGSYYIGIHEVTNAEYHAFWIADGGENSAHTPVSYGERLGVENWPKIAHTKPNHPVMGVSWLDAVAYAKWVDKRLPTEAEWEKAARGTDSRLWPWGDAFSLRVRGTKVHANVWDGDDGYRGAPAPVGTYPTGASPYGVLDMAGNVWEWVADWYSESYYHWGPSRNPKGPDQGGRRVVRGGSWANGSQLAQCSNRMGHYPAVGTSFIGFRLAKDAEREPQE